MIDENIRVNLGIHSKKTIEYFNYILKCDLDSHPYKGDWWHATKVVKNPQNVAYGNLFIKGEAEIVFDSKDEAYIKFNNHYALDRNLRRKNNLDQQIKDKLANLLKKYWPSESTVISWTKGNENFEITKNEYRTQYEFLKNRNVNKIKEKYGKNTFDNIIGKGIENPFIISSIETIENEIQNIIKVSTKKRTEVENTYYYEVQILRNKRTAELEKINMEQNEKIAKLQQDLEDLRKTQRECA